ncbi:hypothetical protein EVAR_51964_1 [Eumeta japonica]|uniref:Uncharacterized protein n=1 Tax=Eumeta variegata TaxID=151549 RepID=A0A4C1Y0M4_EUMVA|nr:hypothetical protein EVAR_51964_1 [Eumeta japonica]
MILNPTLSLMRDTDHFKLQRSGNTRVETLTNLNRPSPARVKGLRVIRDPTTRSRVSRVSVPAEHKPGIGG